MWSKITVAVILLLFALSTSTAAQGIHLAVDDTHDPQISVDYPFVFPLTGLTERNIWAMSCATSPRCDDNGVRVCGEEETNFGVTSHAGCPLHHTGEDWLVRTEQNAPSTALSAEKLVRSINHGVVVYAGLHTAGNGYVVIVKHKAPEDRPFLIPAYPYAHNGASCGREAGQTNIIYSYYLHLDGPLPVHTGEQVLKGQVLGSTYGIDDVAYGPCSGKRGGGGPRVYCPHLHLEIWTHIKVDNENLFDPNGYDQPGCGDEQFGYRLRKLVEPRSFLETNNARPLIRQITGVTNGSLIVQGEGFGELSGTVVVRGRSSVHMPASVNWTDTNITISGNLDFSSTLRIHVRRRDGIVSNEKGFPFIDVKEGDWFSPSVMDGWAGSLLTGRDQDICLNPGSGGCSFAPAHLVRRSDLITAVIRAIERTSVIEERGSVPGGPSAAPAWLYPFLQKAYGYTNPENNNEAVGIWTGSQVAPEFWAQLVTRQEAAHVMMNALRLAPRSSGANPFSDVEPAIAGWVYACRAKGVFEGDRIGNTFRPTHPLNRAELAKILDMAFLDGED